MLQRRYVWPWFCGYVVAGVLGVLSFVSLGWLLLGPLVLLVGLSLVGSTARRSVWGLAVGAGFAFVYFAAASDGRSYAGSMLVMGVSLLVAAAFALVRRTWVAPR